MRAFSCPVCRRLAPFESVACVHCGAAHGFDWGVRELRSPGGEADLERCANRELAACNGLASTPGELCRACALTRTRPADDDPAGMAAFALTEAAKRRLVFELLELGLPVDGGLAFDLLASSREPVTTGHADGLITIDLAEADDSHREAMRAQMAEPYRTLLGHLRHEIGHYYEPIVVQGDDLDEGRRLFGDEREDYGESLERHYREGPPEDWAEHHVSSYATMHPWEDWAETFAHYLHIVDTLQTAGAFGVTVAGPEGVLASKSAPLHSEPDAEEDDFAQVLETWLPLTYALNALNRSMGADDLYPFVLTPSVMDKLGFVHRMVRAAGTMRAAA